MEVVKYPCEALKIECRAFDFDNNDGIQVAKILAESMIEHNGLGIAANQLGFDYRAVAINAEKVVVMFNPKIVSVSDEQSYLVEGCLSAPNLFVNIKRPNTIRVRYTEPNQNVVTRNFTGITARVIQHEMDHLDGIFFTKRANQYHVEKARKLQNVLNKQNKIITPQQAVVPISN